jgi:hypothetical protein
VITEGSGFGSYDVVTPRIRLSDHDSSDGRSRRNLAVHQSVDEGRVAALLRTSIIAACTTYALASCLRASGWRRGPAPRNRLLGQALKLNPNVAFSVQSRWLQMAIDTAAAGMDPLSFATPDGQCRRSRATSCVSFRMCRFTGQPDRVIDHRSLTLINAVG